MATAVLSPVASDRLKRKSPGDAEAAHQRKMSLGQDQAETIRQLQEALAASKKEVRERDQQVRERDQQIADFKKQAELSTLEECLLSHQRIVFSKFEDVIGIPEAATKFGYTKVDGDCCPRGLAPWMNFKNEQDEIFNDLLSAWSPEDRAFWRVSTWNDLGSVAGSSYLSRESDLAKFIGQFIEDPFLQIFGKLEHNREVQARFNVRGGIVINVKSVNFTQTTGSLRSASTEKHFLRPDSVCSRKTANPSVIGDKVHIAEHKPPQKLTREMIARHISSDLNVHAISTEATSKKALKKQCGGKASEQETRTTRSPNVRSADQKAKEEMDREREIVAASITQTYNYMIRGGVSYGVLTQGQIFVFLKIDYDDDPGKLYFHIADIQADVRAEPDNFRRTALGQYLAFTLMALGRPGEKMVQENDDICRNGMDLPKWGVVRQQSGEVQQDIQQQDNASLNVAPEESRDADQESEERIRQLPRQCKESSEQGPSRRQGPPDDDGNHQPPNAPGPSAGGSQFVQQPATGQSKHDGSRHTQGETRQERPYCTQKCLLGLVSGGFMDVNCPNAVLHHATHDPGPSRGRRLHSINHAQFMDLLRAQLRETLVRGFKPLGLCGATGAVFKVTLLEYGYTMVTKATTERFIEDLLHEETVYRRLQPIQGKCVPVCLGSIDLRTVNRVYYWDIVFDLVHLLFLSFAGESLRRADTRGQSRAQLERKTKLSLRAVHELGVVHEDVRLDNLMISGNRLMVIDFERSRLLEPVRHILLDKTKVRTPPEQKRRSWQRRLANFRAFSQEIQDAGYVISKLMQRQHEMAV